MNFFWTAVLGIIAGVIARLIAPGKKEPSGFLLAAILGAAGAFAGTYLGEEAGWYDAGESAGVIGAIFGAVIVLAIWGFLFRRRSSSWL
jgi:LPXTG-motif cell wall-anchored protein